MSREDSQDVALALWSPERALRVVREEWPIPDRLGLPIPAHLRI